MHLPLYDVRALVALARLLLPEKDKTSFSRPEARVHTDFFPVQQPPNGTFTCERDLSFWTRLSRSLSTSDKSGIQQRPPWNCHAAIRANASASSQISAGAKNGSPILTSETVPDQSQVGMTGSNNVDSSQVQRPGGLCVNIQHNPSLIELKPHTRHFSHFPTSTASQAPSHPPPNHASSPSLPVDKLACPVGSRTRQQVVLVAPGSFNPPTNMHLRMMELAREAMTDRGYAVLGSYLSPVNDAYGKKGLAPAEHRIAMCHLASRDSPFLMVDSWEATEPTYQRTLNVLKRLDHEINAAFETSGTDRVRVVLVCGTDVLHSLAIPGVWIPEQVEELVRDFGVVCISRNESNSRQIIYYDDLLYKHRNNIEVVDEWITNDISSSKIRQNVRRGLSILYLTPLVVIRYIDDHKLYK